MIDIDDRKRFFADVMRRGVRSLMVPNPLLEKIKNRRGEGQGGVMLINHPGVLEMLVKTAKALTDNEDKIISAVMKGSGGTASPHAIREVLGMAPPRPKWLRIDRSKPTHGDGFYPTLICYDQREGVFPSAASWTNGAWVPTWKASPIMRFIDVVFQDEHAAMKFAYQNDPDDPDW